MIQTLRRWLGLETRALGDPVLSRLFGTGSSSSGEAVTFERSVGLSAVWACVSLISGTVASLPLVLYRRTEDGGRERATDHPLYSVLRVRPNPVQSVVAFWEAQVTALLLRGNCYASITRDDDQRVRALWFLHPDRVSVDVTRTGRLVYQVWSNSHPQKIPADQILHVTGPLSDDGYLGRSILSAARDVFGHAMALETYGSEFFSNAATPRGILTTPKRLSDAARNNLAAALTETAVARGKRHRALILEEELKWEAIGISHEDSQFLEARRFSVEEIARLFGVPVHMISGDQRGSMTYANAESEGLRLLKHTIGPWLMRLASSINFACLAPGERPSLYAEYLPDALLATSTKERYESYKLGLEAGFLTVAECRAKENLPALPETVPSLQ